MSSKYVRKCVSFIRIRVVKLQMSVGLNSRVSCRRPLFFKLVVYLLSVYTYTFCYIISTSFTRSIISSLVLIVFSLYIVAPVALSVVMYIVVRVCVCMRACIMNSVIVCVILIV